MALDKANLVDIKNKLIAYNSSFNDEADTKKLDILLKSQGNYLKIIRENNSLSKLVQVRFWDLFDSVYGTNYSNSIRSKISCEKFFDEAQKIFEAEDFLDFDL